MAPTLAEIPRQYKVAAAAAVAVAAYTMWPFSTLAPVPKESDLPYIPYDAPLSIAEPWMLWLHAQAFKGRNTQFLTLPPADLTGKWIIISGSNNGIGREAALLFAAWGGNLILACRDPPAKEIHPTVVVQECKDAAQKAGKNVSVEWWEWDGTSVASVNAFADRWLATGRPLDILCNNAGIGSTPGGTNKVLKSADGFEILHQVNFLSHALTTLRLLPSLAKAKEPRVVCTTSCFHFYGEWDMRNFNGALGRTGPSGVQFYMNNKLWFQTWLAELQRRLLKNPELKHITVNGVHPGYVNTGVWNLNAKSWTEPLLKAMANLMAISPQQGSLCILNAATADDAGPDVRTQGVGNGKGKGGGRYYNRIWEDTPMPHSLDPDCRSRVWRKINEELDAEANGLVKGL